MQYEYRIESFEDITFDTGISKLGDEGWELVFARRALTGEEYSRRGIRVSASQMGLTKHTYPV
ncbi:hypothetical protein [uncultured Nostoc sp.]|uniref:hypothetical protein n=1 Tax=uncultured Nostoc sp. TaxID=340711 RepID=UPI0035C9EE21